MLKKDKSIKKVDFDKIEKEISKILEILLLIVLSISIKPLIDNIFLETKEEKKIKNKRLK